MDQELVDFAWNEVHGEVDETDLTACLFARKQEEAKDRMAASDTGSLKKQERTPAGSQSVF